MHIANTIDDLRRTLVVWRAAGERIAFVPTMGNLHAGHLRLVEKGRALASRVVVSIFVNPLQFGPTEDFARYPRTEAADLEALRRAGADAVFLPTVEVMYPRPIESATLVEVPGLSADLCGAFRPALFRGVTTVVARLFNIVQPSVAIFGEKDFQQLTIVRRMVEDLAIPVDIIGVPTEREPSGLAMSSRNGYLDQEQRLRAGAIYAMLNDLARQLRQGSRDFATLEIAGGEALKSRGLRPDYVAIRRVTDLQPPDPDEQGELVILVAAWLQTTRLIDNLRVGGATTSE